MAADGSPLRRLIAPVLLAILGGCASDALPPQGPGSKAVEKPHPRTREMDLNVPPSSADLTGLDEAALVVAIRSANARVNELLAESLKYAAEYEGNDLSRDATYRRLLLDMKIAETELGQLEEEQARRRK